MKNKILIIVLTILSLPVLFSVVYADGYFYPIGQNEQQTYPVPQYYPNGQQQNPYPGYTYPNQQPYYQQPETPYYNNPGQGYIPPFTPNYPPQSPYYDPYWQMYFYPVDGSGQPGPVTPQYPYYPGQQNSNVQTSKQWSYDGSVNLTWTIRNVTAEDWSRANVDIKCISGCHLLKNPSQTLWDIPYTVKRNGMLSFTVNIWNPMYGESMTFSMVAGSKTLYTFTVNTN